MRRRILLRQAAKYLSLVLAIATAGAVATSASASTQAKCLKVSPKIVKAIQTGLERGLTLRGARAVKSGDYRNVFMVAADIQGPGLKGKNDTAVWATNRLNDYGLIYSADALATEFSDWGNGPGFSSTDDGVYEAKQCSIRSIK
jgi:hypothetical protein